MLTLSIDTTAEFGSIALLRGREVLGEVLIHAPQGFGQVLFDRIKGLIGRHGIGLKEMDLFAAASGPGSFTGVRVGLAAIKGFAEVCKRPAIAVSNLRALASLGTSDLRAAIIDARRGEVYAALYDGFCHALIREQVIPFPQFAAALPPGDIEWICADFAPFYSGQTRVIRAPRGLAAAIGLVALDTFGEGRGVFPPEAIDANYVRRSDAELLFKGST